MFTKVANSALQMVATSSCSNFKGAVRKYTPRRALLYVPGNDKKKLTKAFGLDVDLIAMDCEDGVAINQKAEARSVIRSILDERQPKDNGQFDLGVRVNSIQTEWFKDDISSVLSAKSLPDTILLPKVEKIGDIKEFSAELDAILKQRPQTELLNLIIYIESAWGFINLVDICRTAAEISERFRPVALVFGSDDFCANIGATRTESSTEILYARQKLVMVAKAFGLQAIDMVYIKFKDLEGLRLQSEEGARMGYTGKQVIHPAQVPVVQEAFLPNIKHIEWARGLLEAFNDHQTTGKGAFTYLGSMIDMPTMKQAQNIMDLVRSVKQNV